MHFSEQVGHPDGANQPQSQVNPPLRVEQADGVLTGIPTAAAWNKKPKKFRQARWPRASGRCFSVTA